MSGFAVGGRPADAREQAVQKTLELAVRDFVEMSCRAGDLGGNDFAQLARRSEGTRAHRKIQKTRPAEYAAEVPVTYRHQTDELIVVLNGRIDGLYQYPDRVIIEEIKTTRGDVDALAAAAPTAHWAQLYTYAHIYALQHELPHVTTRLVYVELDSGKLREVQRTLTTAELTVFFEGLLTRYLAWAQRLATWQQCRDASLRELAFPYTTYRAGQRAMAVEVYSVIKQNGQLLMQAPTGIGKTMAAMFPALKALGEGATEKLFYLTARTTGRTAAEQALASLRRQGLRCKSITLTAKEKACAQPHLCCQPNLCPLALGYFDRIDAAVQDAMQEDAWTPAVVARFAEQHRVCPFELSLDLALCADVIIGDYNYAFDPRVYLKRFFRAPTGTYTFLVDEAHNLVDRARDMFSAALSKQHILDVRRALKSVSAPLFKCLGKINRWFLHTKKQAETRGAEYAEAQRPDDLLPLLENLVTEAETWLARNPSTPLRGDLLEVYFAATWFLKVAEDFDAHYVTCVQVHDQQVLVRLFCLDPSARLRDALTRCQAVTFFSATLTPLTYFQTLFGCESTARAVRLPSPFPKENLRLLMMRVSTLYRHRDHTVPTITAAICEVAKARRGNYLVFFPSYAYLRTVAASVEKAAPNCQLLLQTPDMHEDERAAFLAEFSHDKPETLLGFAVMGGIFGEGIDLVGDRLTGAIIVGVGLPGICLERDLIRAHFAEQNGQGFEFAYMYPGFNRVLQAAGRVIRTEQDRGVVVLLDTRFYADHYQALFPNEWRPVHLRSAKEIRPALTMSDLYR